MAGAIGAEGPRAQMDRGSPIFGVTGVSQGIIEVRSGMGAYAGVARRHVHLATVLLRPPPGHRPGRRQARILQTGLHLTQT